MTVLLAIKVTTLVLENDSARLKSQINSGKKHSENFKKINCLSLIRMFTMSRSCKFFILYHLKVQRWHYILQKTTDLGQLAGLLSVCGKIGSEKQAKRVYSVCLLQTGYQNWLWKVANLTQVWLTWLAHKCENLGLGEGIFITPTIFSFAATYLLIICLHISLFVKIK